MDLKGKKVLVVGLAKTGTAVIPFLVGRGARVMGVDEKSRESLESDLKSLEGISCDLEVGHPFPSKIFEQVDLIVVSPGVPLEREPFDRARAKGISIVGELELASRFLKKPILAITGTNGKTTTTTLIGEMLRKSNIRCFVGGNIGNPLIHAIGSESEFDWIVVEVSSFQLESIQTFRPKIAVLLNLAEDHLDRYPSVKEYFGAKLRLFSNQQASDDAVLNGDEPIVLQETSQIPSRKFLFGSQVPSHLALLEAFFRGENIVFRGLQGEETYPLKDFRLVGEHNRSNLMAAIVASRLAGATLPGIIQAYQSFQGLEHRLEYVTTLSGIDFYNDSKATTVDSVLQALRSFERPVLWIAGGKDKGLDYSLLREIVRKRVRKAILMGEAAPRIREEMGPIVSTVLCSSLEEAVVKAYEEAHSGDVVLLSPACSSYDMFKNYEERGDIFKNIVRRLGHPDPRHERGEGSRRVRK
ncbi:MAG: UDP-N-acetylmuramoyl-L-alanine--D-glutamate ligase [Deltaproteobacteria bacterium]|nr:UDP-N-acetylmuramoyl-L-alanine--D-glutamate ligase [Deltaproteobacteria bacterium]